jgi:succinyldiaminopimelate transaminase
VLPDFPWDLLAPHGRRAAEHPGGLVDLSIGTPVDPTPAVIRDALAAASDAPGYPRTAGTPALRAAAAGWLRRVHGVTGLANEAVLPTIGSKELVALLPMLLRIGPGDRVMLPAVSYPTYEVGVRLVGAKPIRADSTLAAGPAPVRLVWLNSPANPSGRVLPPDHLRKVVDWARERGAVVASDECYLDFGWEAEPVSVLHPSVTGGDHTGVLAVHSLSKRSNLAGYRAGFVAGDPRLVAGLLEARKHAGLILPEPVQAAATAAYADDAHVAEQRARYAERRALLRPVLEKVGFTVEHSEAGLYLWATRGRDSWQEVAELAELGVLVAPGAFYGPAGERHVRIALTATDERVAAAAERLGA